MKKILYLAIIALGLQSCLKDKENESDFFNKTDASVPLVSFTEPNTMRIGDILKSDPLAIPRLDIDAKTTTQILKIRVVVVPNVSSKDIVVNITDGGLAKVTEFNEAQKVLPALPLPQVPVYPAGYTPFVILPVGKYLLPSSVTIKAGQAGVDVNLEVPNALIDLSLTANYMLPISLSTTDGTKVIYPTTLFKVGVANDFAGEFTYSGKAYLVGQTNPYFIVNEDRIITTIDATASRFPVGLFNDASNMKITFDKTAGTLVIGGCPSGLCNNVVPPALITSLPSGVPPNTGDPLTDIIISPNPPVITYNASGKLQSITGLNYAYRNPSGQVRLFYGVKMTRKN